MTRDESSVIAQHGARAVPFVFFSAHVAATAAEKRDSVSTDSSAPPLSLYAATEGLAASESRRIMSMDLSRECRVDPRNAEG
jgi:hypothetical protein